MTKIAIFDYGAGNLFSLKSALERNGAESVHIIYNLRELSKFSGLILPGVGNFDPAIRSIEGSSDYLDKAIDNCMPLLGICLGMEILFNKSEEGKLEGLKILNGEVVMLPKGKVKVPHMGWNNLKVRAQSKLLKGVKDQSWVYFVHSYRTVPKDRKLVVATSDYGVSIPAMIEKNNLIGVQFHPEKSGDVGALMIRNFIELCRKEAK
ncbi:MAG TPA: imidazole glycerol phosphate synthase subunit HisH [Nitrososphaera sp.]|jgi:imidazole glycerol-phosphate synthase subunit HisH|nr:imidazole glycerol phosphate synthase subunit HisH [Nitrososphaera sp.]